MTDALLLERDLSLRLGRRDVPSPQPGQALVRVEWAGVCGSDLHVLRSGDWVTYWPATLGHEAVGIVEACPGGELVPGTRVVVDSRVPCGSCEGCHLAPNRCEQLRWVGEIFPGCFARHCTLPVGGLLACPSGIEPAIAVLTEPLAVAMHAVSKVAIEPTRALILGYGPIGALVHLEIARRWPGVEVSVEEPLAPRRQLARAAGALAREPGSHLGPASWPLVVDAAGYPGSLANALRACGIGGMALVVALGHGAEEVEPSTIVERGLWLAGANGFDAELPAAAALLSADPDRYRPVVTEALLLEEAPARLRSLLVEPAAGKVVIRPWEA